MSALCSIITVLLKNMRTRLKSTVPSITSVDLSGNGASHYSGSQSHVSGHGVSIAIYAW